MREIRWCPSDAKAWQGALQKCALRLEDELAELNAGLSAWNDCFAGHPAKACQSGAGPELARGLKQAIEKGSNCAERLRRLSQMLNKVCALFDEVEQENAALPDASGTKEPIEETRFPQVFGMPGAAGLTGGAFHGRILYTDALPQGSQWIIPDWLGKAAMQSLGGFLGIREDT